MKGKDIIKYIIENGLEESDVEVVIYEGEGNASYGDEHYKDLKFEDSDSNKIAIRVII